jgi:hypothetical protein
MLDRRQFFTAGAAIVVSPSILMQTGCAFNTADAINAVLNSGLAILKVVEPGSALATQLSDAISALQQAEATWQTGGTSTIVVDALNTIEAVIAVIPVTASYAPLVDILVAGIETVMSAFGVTPTVSMARSPSRGNKRALIVNSPHFNAVRLNGPSFRHPTWQGAYRNQWNTKAKAIGLSQAQIH